MLFFVGFGYMYVFLCWFTLFLTYYHIDVTYLCCVFLFLVSEFLCIRVTTSKYFTLNIFLIGDKKKHKLEVLKF